MVEHGHRHTETFRPLLGPTAWIVHHQPLNPCVEIPRLNGLSQGFEIAAVSGCHHPQLQRGLVSLFVLARVSQSGVRFMSHLSILPTVFTDLERLIQALGDEGFTVERTTELHGFADDSHAVDVLASQGLAMPLGWTQREDGTIVMHGDIQRISRQPGLEQRLQRVTRRYALLHAMDQVRLGELGSVDLILQTH